MENPLILTVRLDQEHQSFFDVQRGLYFPPERNFLKAHITLFHQLPDFDFDEHPIFSMQIVRLINLGAGVAYRIESLELLNLHRNLARKFDSFLIPQDRQGYRPHIVVQNKVMPEQARELIKQLEMGFKPFEVQAIGLDLWTYLGGPWRHETYYPFTPAVP